MTTSLRTLYPEIEPFQTGRLQVSDVHEIYFEQSGNPEGKPAIFVHGGPGGGSNPAHRRYHDPSTYRIVVSTNEAAVGARPMPPYKTTQPGI